LAVMRRGAAPLPARTISGRGLFGAAFRAGDGAPHNTRQRAAGETVGGLQRSQRRRRDPRPHRRGVGDGADRQRGRDESAREAGDAGRAVIAARFNCYCSSLILPLLSRMILTSFPFLTALKVLILPDPFSRICE